MYCKIVAEPIDVAALIARTRSDEDGAVVLFTGVVRNRDNGRAVEELKYEAYEAMATAVLREICTDVRERFAIGDLAVVHRVGDLTVGEASVAIVVAAPHRDAAYKASREIIERLKREVPIWKRERFADGGEEWLEGIAPEAPRSRRHPSGTSIKAGERGPPS